MALPKNFKKDLNIIKDTEGVEKRWEMVDNIDSNQGFLPRSISHEDMDKSFVEFIKNDLSITVEGEKVPVYIISIQRWAEFYRTWENSDEYGNLKLPFIAITRKIDVQRGTTHALNYNIPGFPTWTYVKVPVTDGIRGGYDVYKVPQPIAVDITYDVRFFCEKIRHLNVLNKKVLREFSARQRYIDVNGHPMPVLSESIGDESQVDVLESRKFYVQPYEMKLMGYLLVEEDFEVIPAINRIMLMQEITDKLSEKIIQTIIPGPPNSQTIQLILEFTDSTPFYTVVITNGATYNTVDIINVSSWSYSLNNGPNTTILPFNVVVGDRLKIFISKSNINNSAIITFNGVI